MASAAGTPADLLAPGGVLERHPDRFTFYAALRLIDCAHPGRPRIGMSDRPVQDPARFGEPPFTVFAPCDLASYRAGGGDAPARLATYCFGLFGPHGPLPSHLTEYALQRARNYGDLSFVRFADLFHHRMIALFYRAWAAAQPALALDRPESDRFATYVGATIGLGMPSLRGRDSMPDHAKLFFAGRLSGQTRSADDLEAMLGAFFEVPLAVEELVGEWLDLPAEHQLVLGASRLDGSVILGARMWACQHKIRVVAGPLTWEEYEHFLPGGPGAERLFTLVRNTVGDEVGCELQLVLRREDVPAFTLDGTHRLGRTTWLKSRALRRDPDEMMLAPAV